MGVNEPRASLSRSHCVASHGLRTSILSDGRIKLTFRVSTGRSEAYLVQRRVTSVDGTQGD